MLLAGGRSTRHGRRRQGPHRACRQADDRARIARLRPQVGRIVDQRQRRPGALSPNSACRSSPTSSRARPVRSPDCRPASRGRRARAPEARYVVTAPADAPFLPLDLVTRLRAAPARERRDRRHRGIGRRTPSGRRTVGRGAVPTSLPRHSRPACAPCTLRRRAMTAPSRSSPSSRSAAMTASTPSSM